MFDIFRKKTQVEKLIDTDGIEHATDRFADIIIKMLNSREIAYQFIREELEGASEGNSASQLFAASSGMLSVEYRDAMKNSMQEVDGPDGPQQLILSLSLELAHNQELMAQFRCKIDDKIMRKLKLGQYSQTKDRIDDLLRLLNNILGNDGGVMPVLAPNIAVPAIAKVRHIANTKKNIASARELILFLSKMTGDNIEAVIKSALQKNDEKNINQKSSLDKKYSDISNMMISSLNQGGVAMLDQSKAILMIKEIFNEFEINSKKISEQDLLKSQTLVTSFFVMMYTANSAFIDNEKIMAKHIFFSCKNAAKEIMQTSYDQYNSIEHGMIDLAFSFMKKIDEYAE